MTRIQLMSMCLVLLATGCGNGGGIDIFDDGFDPRNLVLCDSSDPNPNSNPCEGDLVCYDGTLFDYCSPSCTVDTDCPGKYDCETDQEDVEAGECEVDEGACDALENSAECAP